MSKVYEELKSISDEFKHIPIITKATAGAPFSDCVVLFHTPKDPNKESSLVLQVLKERTNPDKFKLTVFDIESIPELKSA